MPQLSSLNKTLGWTLFLALLVSPTATYKVEASSFELYEKKYEVTLAGATTVLAPRVEIFSPSKKPAQLRRKTTIHTTEQQGEYGSRQPVPQWILNVIGLEIGINLAILTTLIRRSLKHWQP